MASSLEDNGRLTNRQIARLAASISSDNMESIAEGYMDIDTETVKNIRRDASNSEAFNRDIIRFWANKNPDGQVEVSFKVKLVLSLPFEITGGTSVLKAL